MRHAKARFEDLPLPIQRAAQQYTNLVRRHLPTYQGHRVTAGRNTSGVPYATVTVEMKDPHRALDRAAYLALRAAFAARVAVAAAPAPPEPQFVHFEPKHGAHGRYRVIFSSAPLQEPMHRAQTAGRIGQALWRSRFQP